MSELHPEFKEYARHIPAAWQILLNIEAEPKKLTKEQRQKVEQRLDQLNGMNLRVWDVELNLERKQLENLLK